MNSILVMSARMLLACVLGGVIGYERESTNRPAGFRTHILVCIGSALIMMTSEFMFDKYVSYSNMDPARLGAQIISGIGFLCAGTIIRDGFNVKGLTTAASLWAVSAVGIAAGIGFYQGAVAAAIFIYITLIALKNVEGHFFKKDRYRAFFILADGRPGQIGEISAVAEKLDMVIRNIEFHSRDDDSDVLIKLLVKLSRRIDAPVALDEVRKLEGVRKAYEEGEPDT